MAPWPLCHLKYTVSVTSVKRYLGYADLVSIRLPKVELIGQDWIDGGLKRILHGGRQAELSVMNKKAISNLIKLSLTAAVAYFLWIQISQNWEEVVQFEWKLHPGMLALSIGLHLLTFAAFSKVWSWLIGAYGFEVKFRYAFKIGYLANLGRYLPGKIWPVFGMAYIAKQVNIDERASVTSWAVALVYAISSSFAVCACIAAFYPELIDIATRLVPRSVALAGLSLVALVSLTLIIYPQVVSRVVNIGLRVLRRETLDFDIDRKTSFRVFLGYAACWMLYGLSFWTFLQAINAGAEIPIHVGIMSFILSYQIGYFAFFAPGGIGVRELALTYSLGPFIGPLAAGVAVAGRLWNISVEIIAALVALKIKLPEKKRVNQADSDNVS